MFSIRTYSGVFNEVLINFELPATHDFGVVIRGTISFTSTTQSKQITSTLIPGINTTPAAVILCNYLRGFRIITGRIVRLRS